MIGSSDGGSHFPYIPASSQKDSLSECFEQEVGGGDIAATVLQMLYHVREANAVFLTKVMFV